MEQRPVDGEDRLAPPTADVAQAYLAEVERVRSRRDERVDRRALAVASLVNGVVLSVYVTIASFAIGVSQAGSAFIVLVALFLLWVQLSAEYRESRGALGPPLAQSRSVSIGLAVLLVVIVVVGFVVSAVAADPPVLARVVPGLATLLITGIPAVRDIRRSRRMDAARSRPLTASERWATVVVGAIMAASIWILAEGGALVAPTFAVAVMITYVAWWIAGRISDRLPALGAVWAWPQWSSFAIAGVAVAALIVAGVLGVSASISAAAPIVAVAVCVLFVISVVLDGRDG